MNQPKKLSERIRLAFAMIRGVPPYANTKAVGKPSSRNFSFQFPAWRTQTPQWATQDTHAYITNGFEQNSIVHAAIMYKVRAASLAPLRAYTGDVDNPTPLPPTHPLSLLCSYPNQYQRWGTFESLNVVYLNVTGNVFILLKRPTRGGLPNAMYTLNPTRVFVIPSESGIKGYLYVPEGKGYMDGIPILIQDMLHVKLPNPGDPLEGLGYGMSPYKPASQSLDVDNRMTEFLQLFFQNGSMPNGILEFDTPMMPEDITTVKERWKEMYGGSENWAEIGVLDQGGKYQRIGLTFEEMAASVLDQRNAFRIISVLGVPPMLIGTPEGLQRSTYANMAESRQMFWQDVEIPEKMLFSSGFQYYLQSPDGGFVDFDYAGVPALRIDVNKAVDSWEKLVLNGIEAYQAARAVGLNLGDAPGSSAPTSLPDTANTTDTNTEGDLTQAELDAQANAGKRWLGDYNRQASVEFWQKRIKAGGVFVTNWPQRGKVPAPVQG